MRRMFRKDLLLWILSVNLEVGEKDKAMVL